MSTTPEKIHELKTELEQKLQKETQENGAQETIAEERREKVQAEKEQAEKDRIEIIEKSAYALLEVAFQHYFGFDGTPRDSQAAYNLIAEVSAAEISQEAVKKAPSVALARALVSMSAPTHTEDTNTPFKFFVPGKDFYNNREDLPANTAGFCMFPWSRAFRTTVAGRMGTLIAPQLEHCDIKGFLGRCAHSHPNVIGPIGIACSVRAAMGEIIPFVLIFQPLYSTVKFVDKRELINLASSRQLAVLKLARGVAEGLSHLHQNGIVHGDVSIDYMRIQRNDNVGMIVTGAGFKRGLAPECYIDQNKFSAASDVFQFGHALLELITGSSWDNEDNDWIKQSKNDTKQMPPFFKYLKAIKNDYALIKSHIPKWCPDSLTQIILRCLNYSPSKRPHIDKIVAELKTLENSNITNFVEEKPKLWMDLNRTCLELIADKEELCPGSIYEHLYGSKVQAELLKNYEPKSGKAKIILEKLSAETKAIQDKIHPMPKSQDSRFLNPKLPVRTRAIWRHKLKHFNHLPLFEWNGFATPFYGIRHFPSFALGEILYSDMEFEELTRYNPKKLLKTSMLFAEKQMWCDGESEHCRCDRDSRPKQPKLIAAALPDVLMREILGFLQTKEHNIFALTSKYHTIQVLNYRVINWRTIGNSDPCFRDKTAQFLNAFNSDQLKLAEKISGESGKIQSTAKVLEKNEKVKKTVEIQKIARENSAILAYAIKQKWGVVRTLLKKGCSELDAVILGKGSDSGLTALHLALKDSQFKIAYELLKNGAGFANVHDRPLFPFLFEGCERFMADSNVKELIKTAKTKIFSDEPAEKEIVDISGEMNLKLSF